MAYLIDHPPVRSQFWSPRRERPSGVAVVHTAENAPDTDGPDSGAENVAAFIQRRTDPGSYHDLCDADSIVQLVPYDAEAYQDATGSNSHAYAVSAATRAASWGDMPAEWRDATVRNMARAAATYAGWIEAHYGIDIPARRITRAESDARIPGFISHAERDPANRSDPGAEFPWDQFLAEYDAIVHPQPVTVPEVDMHPGSGWDTSGRYWVAARGTDWAIWIKTWAPGVGWSAWASIGGIATSGPDLTTGPGGRVDIVCRGTDMALWHNWTADGVNWVGWESLGGQVA